MGTTTAYTIDELRTKWSSMSDSYSQYLEPMSLSLSRALIQAVGIHHRLDKQDDPMCPVRPQSFDVLECAAGSGMMSLELARLLNPQDSLIVTDLTEAFLSLARARLAPFVHSNPSLRIRFDTANALSLQFADASFDRYIASLCLHLVPDADAAIAEAARVLRPGGRAAWSLWGREEHSPVFTIVPKVLKSMNIDANVVLRASDSKEQKPPARSNFHLGGDLQVMREKVLRAGFSKVLAWYQPVVMDVFSGADFAHRTLTGNLGYARLMQSLPPDQAAKFKAAVEMEAEAVLASGRPLCYDAMVIVAIK